jgi:hypothetical protein
VLNTTHVRGHLAVPQAERPPAREAAANCRRLVREAERAEGESVATIRLAGAEHAACRTRFGGGYTCFGTECGQESSNWIPDYWRMAC